MLIHGTSVKRVHLQVFFISFESRHRKSNTMKNKDLSRLERILFVVFCLVNLFPLFYSRWFPSMDGPAHIYTANIVKEIIRGNIALKEFFSLSLLVPNLTGSFLLSLFQFVFPAWLAEKLLIILILILLPVSFRYFVFSFKNKPTLLTLAIFPFTWHFLFMIGFYNYSLGLSLALFALGYYTRTREACTMKETALLGLLTLLLAFTHIFVFVIFGIMWLALLLGDMVWFFRKADRKTLIALFVNRYAKYLIGVLPGLMFAGIYLFKTANNSFSAGADRFLTVGEHFHWLFITRPLVIYYMEKESVFGIIVFAILVGWTVASFISGKKDNREKKSKKTIRFFLLAGTIVVLILYFILPDYKAGAGGHLSLRLLIPFYVFFIAWLGTRKLPQWLQTLGVAGLLFSTVMLWKIHLPELRQMSLEAESLVQAGKRIPAGSVILPINAGDHWLQPHFLNYLGAENSLVILENTVASGDGIICWADPKANLPRRFGGNLMFEDTALFDDPLVQNRVDAVIVWKAERRNREWSLFSEKMLDKFIPYDTVCAGYGWIYIHKKYKPDTLTLLKWTRPLPPRSSAVFILTEPRNGNDEFFEFVKKPLLPGYQKTLSWYRFELAIRSNQLVPTDSVYLTYMIENKGNTMDYDAFAVHVDTITRMYKMEYHPPFKINEGDILKMYLWNPSHQNLNILYGKGTLYTGK